MPVWADAGGTKGIVKLMAKILIQTVFDKSECFIVKSTVIFGWGCDLHGNEAVIFFNFFASTALILYKQISYVRLSKVNYVGSTIYLEEYFL
ncbi:MAG TPA: hypothetical protein DCZ55_01295 [Cyanobacteria bacterium UBA11371]|nr:hypothetical protein [Cyanobacteria bacterium UBA11371]HBE30093.1 hypothetical protein [Cyanobacteria bacterium UBA11368]